jgi:hypothetical protein
MRRCHVRGWLSGSVYVWFLNSVVCKAARLVIRDRLFLHQRVCSFTYWSFYPVDQSILFSVRGLIVCDVLVPAYGWIFGFR